MGELSDAFLLLPGGIGTIEEFWETFTHVQRTEIRKPCGL
jgi:predicted Rossmann-fold nucleotide-binding protein